MSGQRAGRLARLATVLGSVGLLGGCSAWDPEAAGLGVYVDPDTLQPWLVGEICSSSARPSRVEVRIAGDDNFASSEDTIATYKNGNAPTEGWWMVPLFDLERADYGLTSGFEFRELPDEPVRISAGRAARGGLLGSIVISDLPPPGYVEAIGFLRPEHVIVKGPRPDEISCATLDEAKRRLGFGT